MLLQWVTTPSGMAYTRCTYPSDGTIKGAWFAGHIGIDACIVRIADARNGKPTPIPLHLLNPERNA